MRQIVPPVVWQMDQERIKILQFNICEYKPVFENIAFYRDPWSAVKQTTLSWHLNNM